MQQLSLLDLAEAAARIPAPLVAVEALGAIIEPEVFAALLERGLELVTIETAAGPRRYVSADELAAYLIAPLLETPSGETVH